MKINEYFHIRENGNGKGRVRKNPGAKVPPLTKKEIRYLHSLRSLEEQRRDIMRTAKRTFRPTSPKVERLWVAHPDHYDVAGIDTTRGRVIEPDLRDHYDYTSALSKHITKSVKTKIRRSLR